MDPASRGGCLFVAFVLVGVLSLAAPAPGGEGETGDAAERQASLLFNTASRLYRQQNWRDAAVSFGHFLERFPRHRDAPEARFARGYCYNRLGEPAAAVADLTIARRDRKARWAADASFYLGRSLEALARDAPEGSAARSERLRAAATSYGEAARTHAAALEKAPAGTDAARRKQILDRQVLSLTAQGEALYHAGDLTGADRALVPLLSDAGRYETATKYARGLYILALARHGQAELLERSGTAYDRAPLLACLRRLAGPRFERDPVWADAVYLLARLLQREGEVKEAIQQYDRLVRARGAHAAEAAYHRAVALYETGDAGSMIQAGRELATFHRDHPRHPLAPRARFHEALCFFERQRYDDAATRLRALTAGASTGESSGSTSTGSSRGSSAAVTGAALAPELLARAWLCLGQSLLLKNPPDPPAAASALARAIDAHGEESGRDPAATRQMAQAMYWHAEALLAVGGQSLDRAAATFHQVAEQHGQVVPLLAEESLHKEALALFRAGKHRECAAAAQRYRTRYPGERGRFLADSLELAGRNALQAPAGSLEDEERRQASRYYSSAAALETDASGARYLRYLAGVALYGEDDFAGASEILGEVHGELTARERAAERYAELAFLLGDALARMPAPETEDEASRARLLRAVKLLDEYLAAALARPRDRAARHVPRALVQRGLCSRRLEDHEGARKSFTEFLKRYPEHELAARVRFNLGNALVELGDLPGAVAEYRRIAVSGTETELVLQALGQAGSLERDLGHGASARKLLATALAKFRASAGARKELERLYQDVRFQHAALAAELGDAREARQELDSFLREFPGSPWEADARLQLAHLHLDGREAAKALALLQPMLDATPAPRGQDEALYLTAWSHGQLASGSDPAERTRHLELLEATYRRLISEYPRSDFTLDGMLELGHHLFNGQKYTEAARWYGAVRTSLEKVAATDRDAGERERELLDQSLFGLAFVSFRREDFAGARQLFDRVAKREEGELAPRALFQSARAWMLSRGERQAVQRFEQLVGDLRPRAMDLQEESLLRLGECYHRLQEYGRAVTTLQRLLREFPAGKLSHEGRFALGFALQYLDRFDGAVETFRTVVSETRQPVAARAQYHIGECFMDQKEYLAAAREFLVIAANFDFEGKYRPWFRRALLAAGLAYQAADDPAAAAEQWKELVKRFPDSEEGKAARKRLEEVKR